MQLDLDRFTHPLFSVEGLALRLEGAAGAELRVARLAAGDSQWRDLRLRCARLVLAERTLRCGGTLSLDGVIERAGVALTLDLAHHTGRLALDFGKGETVELELTRAGDIRGSASRFALSRLSALAPQLTQWQAVGIFDGRIAYRASSEAPTLEASGHISGGAFSDANGLHAAEGLAVDFALAARAIGPEWAWQASAKWHDGEAYWQPWYLQAGPSVEARGRLRDGTLDIKHAQLAMDGVRSLAASGRFDLRTRTLNRAALALVNADLAVLGPAYVAPLVAPARAEALRFSGYVSGGLSFEEGQLAAIELSLTEAGIAVSPGLGLGPVSGYVPWRRDGTTSARLHVAGGRWQQLALGAFEVEAQLDATTLAIPRMVVPVLDGAVVLEALRLERSEAGWSGRGAASVEPLSLNRLTEAVGLPVMQGVLAASVPALRVAPGEVTLDGALVISAFDGYARPRRLQVLEPFGVSARLYADVDARHLDLAQLTQTFSFGSITGFIDADVSGLELANWRPVRFDARISSSPGRYPRRISQRAVQNITALGGAGAMAAIQRSLLGIFETFGYREIGLRCRLERGVCRMSGLESLGGDGVSGTSGEPFTIVRGGGIPALNVIGYNRRVDWLELIDRLRRVTASNTAPVVE